MTLYFYYYVAYKPYAVKCIYYFVKKFYSNRSFVH